MNLTSLERIRQKLNSSDFPFFLRVTTVLNKSLVTVRLLSTRPLCRSGGFGCSDGLIQFCDFMLTNCLEVLDLSRQVQNMNFLCVILSQSPSFRSSK